MSRHTSFLTVATGINELSRQSLTECVAQAAAEDSHKPTTAAAHIRAAGILLRKRSLRVAALAFVSMNLFPLYLFCRQGVICQENPVTVIGFPLVNSFLSFADTHTLSLALGYKSGTSPPRLSFCQREEHLDASLLRFDVLRFAGSCQRHGLRRRQRWHTSTSSS